MNESLPSSQDLYPATNRKAAEQLYAIEVALRELVIDELSRDSGPRWYKQRLPADIVDKYVRGIHTERNSNWASHVPHHPIYYIDFPDLAKIINSTWNTHFKSLFGTKDVYLGHLKALEPIRNKLAHNRRLSSQDGALVSAAFGSFSQAIGSPRFRKLAERCTHAPSVRNEFAHLRQEIQDATECMLRLDAPTPLTHWARARDAWWFDSSYLTGNTHSSRSEVLKQKRKHLQAQLDHVDNELAALTRRATTTTACDAPDDLLQPLQSFFQLYDTFASLPRGRGMGHKVELWVRTHDIPAAANNALAVVNRFCEDARQ